MTPFRIGIVGTGAMAVRMAEAIETVPDIDVVAVVSRSKERAEAFAQRFAGATGYDSIAAMADGGGVDLCYIAGSTADHASQSIEALKAGLPTLCEKPMAVSLEEADRVLKAAENAGVFFMEAFWTQCLPAWRAALDKVATGAIGDAHHLYADFSISATPESKPRLFDGPGAGCLLDIAVYPVSFAVAAFGPAVGISALNERAENSVDVRNVLTLTHADGKVSQLSASIVGRGANTAIVTGSKGRVSVLEPMLPAERVSLVKTEAKPRAADTSQDAPPAEEAGFQKVLGRLKDQAKSSSLLRVAKASVTTLGAEMHGFGADQYDPMLTHVRDTVRAGQKESERVPHHFSREVARIIDEAGKAS